MYVVPLKADDLFDFLPFTLNCINSALSTIVLTAVFISSELHKILKDHSCQVKASTEHFLQEQQNNTLFLFIPSPVVEDVITEISEDFANCYRAQFLEVTQCKPHSEIITGMLNTE